MGRQRYQLACKAMQDSTTAKNGTRYEHITVDVSSTVKRSQ